MAIITRNNYRLNLILVNKQNKVSEFNTDYNVSISYDDITKEVTEFNFCQSVVTNQQIFNYFNQNNTNIKVMEVTIESATTITEFNKLSCVNDLYTQVEFDFDSGTYSYGGFDEISKLIFYINIPENNLNNTIKKISNWSVRLNSKILSDNNFSGIVEYGESILQYNSSILSYNDMIGSPNWRNITKIGNNFNIESNSTRIDLLNTVLTSIGNNFCQSFGTNLTIELDTFPNTDPIKKITLGTGAFSNRKNNATVTINHNPVMEYYLQPNWNNLPSYVIWNPPIPSPPNLLRVTDYNNVTYEIPLVSTTLERSIMTEKQIKEAKIVNIPIDYITTIGNDFLRNTSGLASDTKLEEVIFSGYDKSTNDVNIGDNFCRDCDFLKIVKSDPEKGTSRKIIITNNAFYNAGDSSIEIGTYSVGDNFLYLEDTKILNSVIPSIWIIDLFKRIGNNYGYGRKWKEVYLSYHTNPLTDPTNSVTIGDNFLNNTKSLEKVTIAILGTIGKELLKDSSLIKLIVLTTQTPKITVGIDNFKGSTQIIDAEQETGEDYGALWATPINVRWKDPIGVTFSYRNPVKNIFYNSEKEGIVYIPYPDIVISEIEPTEDLKENLFWYKYNANKELVLQSIFIRGKWQKVGYTN